MQSFWEVAVQGIWEVAVHLLAPAEGHNRKCVQLSVHLVLITSVDRNNWVPNTLRSVSSGTVIVPGLGTAVLAGFGSKRCFFVGGNTCAFVRHWKRKVNHVLAGYSIFRPVGSF